MAALLYTHVNMIIVNKNSRVLMGLGIMIALIAGIYLYSQYNPEEHLLFPKCPVYMITGYQCPGCGSQRAFYNLFHGNFFTAFMYNPLMIFLIPYITLGIFIEYIANRNNPYVIHIRNIFFDKWAVLILAVVIFSYTVLRNIQL